MHGKVKHARAVVGPVRNLGAAAEQQLHDRKIPRQRLDTRRRLELGKAEHGVQQRVSSQLIDEMHVGTALQQEGYMVPLTGIGRGHERRLAEVAASVGISPHLKQSADDGARALERRRDLEQRRFTEPRVGRKAALHKVNKRGWIAAPNGLKQFRCLPIVRAMLSHDPAARRLAG
jgi:hypothetical protein